MKNLIILLFVFLGFNTIAQSRITGDLRNDERKIEKNIDYSLQYKDAGKITIDIVVNIDGKVTSAKVNQGHTTIRSTPMQIELKNRAKTLRFESCYHCPKFHYGSIVFKVEE